MSNNTQNVKETAERGGQVDEIVRRRFRCEGCGEFLDEDEVESWDDGFYHVVPVHVCGGSEEACWRLCPEPQPCGPVIEIKNGA